ELPSARRPETLHGRRRDDEDARLLDLPEPALQRRGELVRGRAVPSLVPRLRADEDGAGVRAVRAGGAREAGERDRELDAGGLQDDVARAPHDRVRAGERRAVGKLDRDDDVALVLRRDESGRNLPEPHEREDEE